MRIAGFQINDSTGVARLIGVPGTTVAEREKVEVTLRENYTSFYVTFLGRVDHVETITDVAELLKLALLPPENCVASSEQAVDCPTIETASEASF